MNVPDHSTISREEILARLRAELPYLVEHYNVKSLSLFGSRSRDTGRVESDVDLLVEFARPPGFFGFIELEDHLSRLLGAKVDLVMKSALRARIGRRIDAEAVTV